MSFHSVIRKRLPAICLLYLATLLSSLPGITAPADAQPIFTRAGDATMRNASMQNLHIGLGNNSYSVLTPTSCPPAGQAPTIVSVVCIGTQSATGEEYMNSLSFNVTATAGDAALVTAGSNIDKVGSYLGIQAFAGASPVDVWARNTTIWAAPGFVGGIAGEELDVNNYECDACGNHSFFGYWLSGGGPYPNRAGVFITGANAAGAYQWHFGVQCVAEVKDACIDDDTSNDGTQYETDFLRSTGTHNGVGLNLEGGTFAGGAIGIAANNKVWLDAPYLRTAFVADTNNDLLLTTSTFTVNSKFAYGYFNSSGNHQDVAQTLSSYGAGTNVMTPSGFAESAANNIAVATVGGLLVKGDVACQDGTNIASWTISGLYLARSGALTHVGSDTVTMTNNSSSVAAQWSIQLGIDTANNAPTLSTVINSPAAASCTARIDAISIK